MESRCRSLRSRTVAAQSGVRALNEIARQVFTVLFGRGIVRIAQLGTFLILARLLSPADFGWFGIVTTAVGVAALLGSLGLRASFGYQVGQKLRPVGDAVGTALSLWLPLAFVSSAAVWFAYGPQLPLSLVESAAVIGTGVSALLLIILMQGIFLGRGQIRAFTLSETVPRVALMGLTVVLVVLSGVTLRSALWMYCLSFVLAVPVIMWLAVKGAGALKVNFRQLGSTVRYGLINAVNLLVVTLCARLAMFVIEHYWGAAAAGEFFAAIRVYEIFLEAATVVGMVLFSNAARNDENGSVFGRNARIACWMLWSFLLLAALVALAAPVVVTALAGAEYAAAGPALQVLALSLAPTAASKVLYQTLAGSGNARFGTPILLVSLVVNVLLAIALVPSMGINGGAVALVVGQYLLLAGYIITLKLRYGVAVRDVLVPRPGDAARLFRVIASRISRSR
ncbi:polysaccharide biosynthesis C-terminal domain-containing protein [Mycolicibacterium vaccae]|uniref:oligosaccharide flippase family protein n=1 Tax=Mycolicibacterium vaccae TaxID=1810 RepID=UPI003CFD70E1